MSKINIISYSSSPLQKIMPYFEIQDEIQIFNEKDSSFIGDLNKGELWLDAYIDLYDPKLNDSNYLYQFFLRIEKLCERFNSNKNIRILQNFQYSTTYPALNKVFYLYKVLIRYIIYIYEAYPILIPDILDQYYKYHPYNIILNNPKDLLWNKHSLFRVIHPNDIIHNLLNPLPKEGIAINGIKVGLSDIHHKIKQIFGTYSQKYEEAYTITIEDDHKYQVLLDINYNLESICITQL